VWFHMVLVVWCSKLQQLQVLALKYRAATFWEHNPSYFGPALLRLPRRCLEASALTFVR
jgi:hypothetical protein